MIKLKSSKEIKKMHKSSLIVAEILQGLKALVKPGITTLELDSYAEAEVFKRGGKPAFRGFGGYSYSICTSVNNEIIHGLPSERKLVEGDIISIDFGVLYKGYYGDSAITLTVGTVSEKARHLIDVTREALYRGIEQAVPKNKLGDISFAIQKTAEEEGFSVVRDFTGHGIGKALHEDPVVPNHGIRGYGPLLKVGLVLAIEPMINEGSFEIKKHSNGWTVMTDDDKLSAHFEHTIAITNKGPIILSEIK